VPARRSSRSASPSESFRVLDHWRHMLRHPRRCDPFSATGLRIMIGPGRAPRWSSSPILASSARGSLPSHDPSDRPATGPCWIADMCRQVIEHPEWIPKDWQNGSTSVPGTTRGGFIASPGRRQTSCHPSPRQACALDLVKALTARAAGRRHGSQLLSTARPYGRAGA